jgi:hypothetical protein
MERIVAEAGAVDLPISVKRMVLTKTEAIERYGTSALLLNALVRGGDPSRSVVVTGEDLSPRRDP